MNLAKWNGINDIPGGLETSTPSYFSSGLVEAFPLYGWGGLLCLKTDSAYMFVLKKARSQKDLWEFSNIGCVKSLWCDIEILPRRAGGDLASHCCLN